MAEPVSTIDSSDDPPSRRERLAELIEDRLDVPMAVLAAAWAGLVFYELAVPEPRAEVVIASNVIWGVFVVEFATKLFVSGSPLVFLRRRWPSLIFLALPAMRLFRIIRAVRVLRVLPAARVVGSSYRAIGTARSLLSDRIALLAVAVFVVIFSGGQLIFVLEPDTSGSLSEALWWSANAGLTGTLVFEPTTLPGRAVALAMSAIAVVAVASLAATIGAYFIESRTERAVAESEEPPAGQDAHDGEGDAPGGEGQSGASTAEGEQLLLLPAPNAPS